MAITDTISKFKIKRVLDMLKSKEGRGTELISLYIPPGRQIHEVMNNLREEYGTASNIKSRATRKNVQDAIEKVIQKLKLFKNTPHTGLTIFCGAIPQNGPGSEKMEMYVIEPSEAINTYFYRCDNKFHLEPLQETLREKETYGIIVIDANDAVIASLRGRRMNVINEYHSGVSGKHKTGGQSARRFERIRESEINAYFKRVANHANENFLVFKDLKGLIIGGPGPSKYDFVEGEYLNYMLQEKILGVVDTSYTGQSGVEEAISKSSKVFEGVRYSEEKRFVQKFLYEVGHDTGLGVYGERTVRRYLKENIVNVLLISEKLTTLHIIIACKSCNYTEDNLIPASRIVKFQEDLSSQKCPECSNETLEVISTKDIIDEFIEMGEKSGARVELISAETDEGVMLYRSFGGIAAILKFNPSL